MSQALTTAAVAPPQEEGRLNSKRAIVEDFFAVGASRYAAVGLSFVAGLLQRRFLGPELVGAWQLLGIARQYLSYGDLGVIRGAEQRLPALAATNEREEELQRDAAWTSVLLTMTVLNVLLVAVSFLVPLHFDRVVLWGLRVMAIIAILEAASIVMETATLRTRARFKQLGIQIFVSEALFAVLSIPAILVAGIWGLLAAVVISLAFKVVYMRRVTPERLHWRLDTDRALALLKVGFPLTVFVVLFKTFDTVDRILLARGGDLSALGFYSISSMTAIFLGHLPLVISTVYLPRTMSWFEVSARTDLVRYFKQSQFCVLVLAAVMSAGCYFGMPFVVHLLLPGFEPGIPALKIGVISAIFVSLVQMPIQYLSAARRYWPMAVMMAVTVGLYYGGSVLWSSRLHTGSEWLAFVAWGRLVGYAVLACIMCGWVAIALSAPIAQWAAGMAGACLYAILVIVAVDSMIPLSSGSWRPAVASVAAQLGAAGIGMLPLLWLAERRTGIVAAWINRRRTDS